ncbi:MAG: hypothetical protein OEX02_17990 [Cyclobacteriaceae bacterium]|nr:hypothetical protein [Cyclobacteriaceae bacterium]
MKRLSILYSILFFLAACSSDPPKREIVENHEPETTLQTDDTQYLYISDAANVSVAKLTIGKNVLIETDGVGNIAGVLKNSKRKYYDQRDNELGAISYNDGGLKMKRGDQLVYKLKWDYADKIKLADNEEMNNAIEIKKKEDVLVVLKGGQELDRFRMMNEASNIKLKDSLYITGFQRSFAQGLLLIHEMGLQEKLILMAEVKAAGK